MLGAAKRQAEAMRSAADHLAFLPPSELQACTIDLLRLTRLPGSGRMRMRTGSGHGQADAMRNAAGLFAFLKAAGLH